VALSVEACLFVSVLRVWRFCDDPSGVLTIFYKPVYSLAPPIELNKRRIASAKMRVCVVVRKHSRLS